MKTIAAKWMRKNLKRGKLWYRLALSYVFMLLFTAVFAYLLLDNAFERLDDDETLIGMRRADMALSQLDLMVDDMHTVDFLLARSSVRMSFMYSPQNVINEIELVKNIRSLNVIAGEDIETFFFTLDNSYVYFNDGKYYDYVFWKNRLNLFGMEERCLTWQDYQSPEWEVYNAADGQKRFLYIFPLRQITYNRYDQNAFIVNTFTEKMLLERLEAVLGGDFNGGIQIYHGDRLIYSNNSDKEIHDDEFISGWKESAHSMQKNGLSYYGAGSEESGFRILIVNPSLRFELIRSTYVRNLLVFGIPLLLAGLCIAFSLTRYNYRPIREVMNQLSPEEDVPERDELSYIITGIDEMKRVRLADSEKLRYQAEMLSKQNETIRRQKLTRLLRGKLEPEEAEGFGREKAFSVMVVRLRTRDILCVPAAQEKAEAFARELGYECVECEEIRALAFVKAEPFELSAEAGMLANMLMPFAPVIGVSASEAGPQGIGRAYLEAIAACEDIERSERTWSGFDIRNINYASDQDLNRDIMYLQQAMQTENAALAEQYAKDVLSRIQAMRYMDQKRSRFILINLLCSNIDQWKLEMPAEEMFTAVQTEDFDQFSENVFRIVKGVCAQAAQRNEKHSNAQARKVLDYIAEHCTDYDMSVDQLYKTFDMTEGRFSRLIKEETGFTPREYIIHLRMESARDMLAATMLPVQVVAERVGYVSASHFIKLFKQRYGITPNQFRNNR